MVTFLKNPQTYLIVQNYITFDFFFTIKYIFLKPEKHIFTNDVSKIKCLVFGKRIPVNVFNKT